MPRVTSIVRSANAGEWSALLEGRTDLQKYAASLRRAYNTIITPQGPTSRRPGTMKQAPVYDETKVSALIPFVFNEEQTLQVELANGRFRFHDEDGLLAYTPVAITAVLSAVGDPFRYTAALHGTAVGDHVVLSGFEFSTNLNSRVGLVSAVAGNNVTLSNIVTPATVGDLTNAKSARVYHIVAPYTDADVQSVRYLPDNDTLFLFCSGYEPRKLQRYGAYDWRLTAMDFEGGPFAPINETTTTLTPSGGTGNVVPIMADAITGGTVTQSTEAVGNEGWRAFDADPTTYWEPTTDQTGWLQFQFTAGTAVNGYVIETARDNEDTSYAALDYAPGDFVFAGSMDGVTFVTLDSKIGYLVYDNGRSLYFPLKNEVAYPYYRLMISKCTRNGALPPRVARLLMTSPSSTATTFTASATTGINNDTGFQATDVGRLWRFKGVDGCWRSFKIETRSSTTVITARAQGDPLSTLDATTEWRPGLFSATTGYPTCGVFLDDRLYMGGMFGYPDYVVASVTGRYENMAQTEPDGQVADDNALVLKINARKQSRIVWIATDGRALLVGTGSGEWAISSTDQTTGITARSARARPASRRGSANVEPLTRDSQILFVQRSNRTIREASYVFEVDGYRAPSLSLFASHIGTPRLLQMDFAAEPHALAFMRRGDGTVAALTYNREEDVVGWQVLDFNGFVESISVMPAADGTQDALWMTIRRTINGSTRRFVERMTRFWDFDSTLMDAHFVDCGVVYNGAPITEVYGLYDYVGQRIVGLRDGSPITPVVVPESGMITLPDAASKIVLGIGYDSEVETARPEVGGSNGVSQGDDKRVYEMKMRLWNTGAGRYRTRNVDGEWADWTDLEYLTPQTQMDVAYPLFTGDTRMLDMPQAFSTEGTISYGQSGDYPLPMNVVALIPKIMTA